jgi:hypothetical protein
MIMSASVMGVEGEGNRREGDRMGRRSHFILGKKVMRPEVGQSGGASVGGGWQHSVSRGRG